MTVALLLWMLAHPPAAPVGECPNHCSEDRIEAYAAQSSPILSIFRPR
jgi:hypothetical protein